ncbi:efflux RND transporter periplasmic adaptor subunit [Rhodopirellula baltica]|nr:biotin/lipoyl-binding protein [Rhodopirellula baltica]
MKKLARNAILIGKPVVFDGDIRSIDPLLIESMTNYVETSRARMVAILPLKEKMHLKPAGKTSDDSTEIEARVFGVLIAELFRNHDVTPEMPRNCRIVADQIQSALYPAIQHHRLPFRRSLTVVARVKEFLQGKRLLAAACILAMVALTVIGLSTIPVRYRVACEGVLVPVNRQNVYAPWDAVVREIMVVDGAPVNKGDVLLKLESEILNADLVAAEVAVEESQKLVESLNATIASARRSQAEEQFIELQGELGKAEVELRGNAEYLKVIQGRIKSLSVRATRSGIASGFQIRDQLLRRPVSRGDQLLAVSDPDGPWQLELEIEEFKAGHVTRAFVESSEPLKVEYILATQVEKLSSASLVRVAQQVDLSNEGTGYVLHAIADVPPFPATPSYIGAEVFAKIETGDRAIGYVLFGDIIDFLRRTLWI